MCYIFLFLFVCFTYINMTINFLESLNMYLYVPRFSPPLVPPPDYQRPAEFRYPFSDRGSRRSYTSSGDVLGVRRYTDSDDVRGSRRYTESDDVRGSRRYTDSDDVRGTRMSYTGDVRGSGRYAESNDANSSITIPRAHRTSVRFT